MANQIKEAKVLSIKTLHERGWSQRRIARELGVNRETVARYQGRFKTFPIEEDQHLLAVVRYVERKASIFNGATSLINDLIIPGLRP